MNLIIAILMISAFIGFWTTVIIYAMLNKTEKKMKYNVNDIVEIIGNESYHKFEIGDEVEITEVNKYDYFARLDGSTDNKDQWFVTPNDIGSL